MDASSVAPPDGPIAEGAAPLLLEWYDAHARDLPWRYRPGEAADPYRVWLSEVMLQQTTVAAVRPRFEAWVARWPSVAALAAADEADVLGAWAGLGYYARARNLIATARAVAAAGGFPGDEVGLRALPGLGAYTAAAVAAIALGQRAVVVDANVERVVARLFAIATPLPQARPAIRAAADAITPAARAGDFAQAMMDLGATICTTRWPRCLLCPLRDLCRGFAEGEPERVPVKPVKRARPVRHGTIFWIERLAGNVREVRLVRRPAKGLLGGMRALPTGPWVDAAPGLVDAPSLADEGGEWRVLEETVEHGFTHFTLHLALAAARVAPHDPVPDGEWWPVDALAAAGLPTLFRHAAEAIGRAT